MAKISKNKQFEVVVMVRLGKCFDWEHWTDKAIDILEELLITAEEIDNES
jgi:hypothetical protein